MGPSGRAGCQIRVTINLGFRKSVLGAVILLTNADSIRVYMDDSNLQKAVLLELCKRRPQSRFRRMLLSVH